MGGAGAGNRERDRTIGNPIVHILWLSKNLAIELRIYVYIIHIHGSKCGWKSTLIIYVGVTLMEYLPLGPSEKNCSGSSIVNMRSRPC